MFFFVFCSVALVALSAAENDENSLYEFQLGRTDNDAKWRGRLEIKKDGGPWGSVCYDKGMDQTTANVLCRFMGYKRAFQDELTDNGNGYHLPIHTKNVRCPAHATHFQNCTHSDWGEVDDCYHFDDTVIFCTDISDDDMYNPDNCRDQHDFCERSAHQCHVNYFTTNAIECRKLCGFCGCVDFNKDVCKKYKDQCNKKGEFPDKYRKYYCPKTCGTCTA